MCFKRSKEKPSITPPVSTLLPVDPEITALAEKMGLRPDNRTPGQIAQDIQARNDEAIANSVEGVIKR